MPVLNTVQTKRIQSVLEKRGRVLLAELREAFGQTGNQQYIELLDRGPGDIGDESLADALADLNVARVDRQIHELRDIEAAFRRLRDGSYGVCTDCETEIPFERLQAYPTAKRCQPCQAQHERLFAGGGRPTL
jgi:RNA polymerase-binding transcription factor DksA